MAKSKNKHFVQDDILVGAHIYENTYHVPYGVKRVGEGRKSFVLYGRDLLVTVVIPATVTEIHNSAFLDCGNLQNINFPSGLKKIGDNAFYCCAKLEKADIPEGITSIGKHAFGLCKSLKSVDIPESIKRINQYVFSGCSQLESIVLPDSIEKIGLGAFIGTSLKNVKIPPKVKSIDSCVFGGCAKLEGIHLPEGVETICASAFEECHKLKGITFPQKLKNIGKKAFFRCTSLKAVYIPDHVTIDSNAFADCPQLTIYSSKGSFAEKYAIENNILFVEVPKERMIVHACEKDRDDLLRHFIEKHTVPEELFDEIFLDPAKKANASKCVAFLTKWKDENF